MRHLGHIRKSFNVPHQRSTTPEPPPPPRARRPVVTTNVSPAQYRLSKPPGIPVLIEDDETHFSDSPEPDVEDEQLSPTPQRRKSKPRSSAPRPQPLSQTPVHSTPQDIAIIRFEEELGKTGKRKPTRRQSGLITTKMSITTVVPSGHPSDLIPPRPGSPAFGSPLRRDAVLEEEEEVLMVISGAEQDDEEEEDLIAMSVTRRDKKRKSREKEREPEPERLGEPSNEPPRREREKRRSREPDDAPGPLEGKKPKLKDVTNSPPPRPSLANLDITSGGYS